jgi:hypothetical protein
MGAIAIAMSHYIYKYYIHYNKMGKKGQKGQKGFTIASKSNHSNQSFVCRRRKSTNKMLLIGGASEPNAQINLNSSSNSAGRPYLARASKLGGGVQFNVESDESDDDDYQEQKHKQIVEDETIRYWIFAQYCGVLCAPDSDEWEDFAGEKGTISLIEEAGTGLKDSYLFRKQIRRILHKIKKCWENGDDYCPKKDASKSGRPPAIGLNSAVANMIADLHEKAHMSVAMITIMLNECKETNPDKTVYKDCQVYSCIRRMKPLIKSFRKRKQGDLSVNSAWAQARLNVSAHLGVRMGLYKDDVVYKTMIEDHFGKRMSSGVMAIWKSEKDLIPIHDWLNRELCAQYAIDIERVAWYDEKHIKQQIGGLGKRKCYYKYPRNEQGLVDCENGTYSEEQKCVLNTKFSDQFCGLFGVAINDGVGEVLPKWYCCNILDNAIVN